jgi:hypothetical protein
MSDFGQKKPSGINGSTCGKKGYFTANSYLAQKNILHSLHLFSVVSLHGMALVGPLCGEWGIPSRFPRIYF